MPVILTFFNTKDLYSGMGVGKRAGAWPPWILKFSAKKGCFLSFEWEKSNFTTFGSPLKNLGKIHEWPPLEKILPTPMYSGCEAHNQSNW